MSNLDLPIQLTAYPLALRLFGPVEVLVDGAPLPKMRSRKEEWLLLLLALSAGREISRVWLAETLWPYPDYADEHAGHYLRRSLMLLRRGLGAQADRLTSPTPRSLRLDLDGAYCDALDFDAAIARGDIESLDRAVKLYRGPLIEECGEHWAIPARISREDSYFAAVETLSRSALTRNDSAYARALLRLAAAAAPMREPIHRQLMEVYAAEHQTAEALQVYHDLRARLLRETNSEPDPETTTLYRMLRGHLARSVKVESLSKAPASGPDAPDRSRIKVPSPLTSLIGRQSDVDEIVNRLRTSRLITLAGPGGIGKTRLAIEAGRHFGEGSKGDTVFVDLSSLVDPTLVAQTVLSTISPARTADSGGSPAVTLTTYLQDRDFLLIMDNCEQVLDACAELMQPLLRDCANLRVLATSRERLHVPGEQVWRVNGLLGPGSNFGSFERRAIESRIPDAVRLFAERAATANPDFALSAQNLPVVFEICARLDGIPMAIELAAVAVRAMPVSQLAKRLDDYLHLLGDMPDAGPPRRKTLRAALDWSYNLLDATEQTLLMRLSTFAGGWVIEAAEAVGAMGPEILGLLMRLVDKSLVAYEDTPDGTGRYRLLNTVRQFAGEKLRLSGDEADASRRLREWLSSIASQYRVETTGADQAQWINRLDHEHDNLRAALKWFETEGGHPSSPTSPSPGEREAGDPDDARQGLRLAVDLALFWRLRGHATEGRRHLTELLSKMPSVSTSPDRLRLEAITALADLAGSQSDFSAAIPLYREALEGYRQIEDQSGAVSMLSALGGVASNQGDFADARALFEEALSISRDRRETAMLYGNLGYLAREQGDYPAARAYLEIAVNVSREIGDQIQAASNLGSLAHVVLREQGQREALRLFEETLAAYRALGNRLGEAWTLASMANVLLEQGDVDGSQRLAEEALGINRAAENAGGEAWDLRILGEARVRKGEFGEAEIHLYRALALDGEVGSVVGEAWDNYWLGRAACSRGSVERGREFYACAFGQMVATGLHEGTVSVVKAIADICRQADGEAADRLLAVLDLYTAAADPSNLEAAVDEALVACRDVTE